MIYRSIPPTPPTSQPSQTAAKYTCTEPGLRGATEKSLRRLTRFEYESSLSDLFGADVVTKAAAPIGNFANEVFKKSVSEFQPSFSSSTVDALPEVASSIAELVANSSTYLKRIAPTCLISSNAIVLTDATCVKTFIEDLGLKVFRRPLVAAETAAYTDVLKLSSTVVTNNADRVAVVIGQMLMKPDFLFITINQATASGDRFKVDAYSVASRLSFRVIGSTPDAELLAAAKAGTLSTTAQLKAQALRLLKKAAPNSYNEAPGRRFVRNFIRQWIQIPLARAPDVFYSGDYGVSQINLNDQLAEEALRFGEYIAFEKNGTFADLMTSNAAFPPSTDAAKIMGTTVSSGVNDPKTVPDDRRGLFQRPILMVSSEPRTPPLHRGAQYLQNALCMNMGSPPPNADNVASETKNSIDVNTLTSRQIGQAVTSSSSCLGCHTAINPPGFAFEAFGPLGELRRSERVFDENNKLVNTLPVDSSTLMNLDGQPTSISGPLDLAEVSANSGQMKACAAQQMFRLTRFQLEVSADSCHLAEVETLIRNGMPLLEAFATNAATEDLLWVKIN